MTYSKALYDWLNIATHADTAADLERILSEAKDELTAEEFKALVDVLIKLS